MMQNFILATLLLFATPLTSYSNVKMLCLVNKERVQLGLPPMGMDDLLVKAARIHSKDQAKMKQMNHTGSDNSLPWDRVTRVGFPWISVAENVAFGYSNETTVMEAWMNSPGHRANILGNCQLFGSAVSYSDGVPYFTQVFASDANGTRNVPDCHLPAKKPKGDLLKKPNPKAKSKKEPKEPKKEGKIKAKKGETRKQKESGQAKKVVTRTKKENDGKRAKKSKAKKEEIVINKPKQTTKAKEERTKPKTESGKSREESNKPKTENRGIAKKENKLIVSKKESNATSRKAVTADW